MFYFTKLIYIGDIICEVAKYFYIDYIASYFYFK